MNLCHSSNMNKKGLATIIFIALTVLIVWWYLKPAFGDVFVLRQELGVAQAKLDETIKLKEGLPEMSRKYDDLISEADRISQAVPKNERLPDLLVLLEALSSQNGLILEGITFDSSANGSIEASLLGVPSVVDDGNSGSDAKILDVDLSLNGSQNSLKSFLGAVEQSLRIMDVSAIGFSEQDLTNPSGQDFKVSIKTYFR